MYKNHLISVYLPCRDEEKHLKKVIKKIPKFVDEIIVVSNKSKDHTYEKAQKMGIKAYQDNREINGIGYGFASITGIKKATGDIITTCDGDGTYPIDKLADILDYFITGNYDFISCNRYPVNKNTTIPQKLQLGVALLNLETNLLYGTKIKDILSGMWLIRKSKRHYLHLTSGDWNLSPEIKIKSFTNYHLECSEFHISQHLRYGKTKQHYFKTGFSHAFWILSNRFFPVQ